MIGIGIETQINIQMKNAFRHLVEIKKQSVETIEVLGNKFSYVTKRGLTKKFVGFLTFGEYKKSNIQGKIERVNGFYFIEI